jgi:hypothetical protein
VPEDPELDDTDELCPECGESIDECECDDDDDDFLDAEEDGEEEDDDDDEIS